jgi:hypothetical protein
VIYTNDKLKDFLSAVLRTDTDLIDESLNLADLIERKAFKIFNFQSQIQKEDKNLDFEENEELTSLKMVIMQFSRGEGKIYVKLADKRGDT